jgi:hypothetical protein
MIHVASCGGCCGGLRAIVTSFVVRRKLREQVRPVAGDDASYFVVNDADVVERLDLLSEQFSPDAEVDR